MPYLIDGHNVIAALPDIDLADDNDEAQLVIKLRTWTSRIRRKAIVIFDGGITGGPSADLSSPDVLVVFAAKFHTNADRIIRERLKTLRDAQNWTVISSDLEILDQARLSGAKTLTAQIFSEQLNQPLVHEQEKPDYVSPAAVNAWLEHFPEPESIIEPALSEPIITRDRTKPGQHTRTLPLTPQSREQPTQVREMRSIGEQLGQPVTPQTRTSRNTRVSEKPSEISSEEVDSWLQVFHDPVDSQVLKPQVINKQVTPKRPKKPVVRKTGELTQEEVSAWLKVFPESVSEPEMAQKTPTRPKRKYRQRKLDKKLAQHKAKLVSDEDKDKTSLSDEDNELWQRMFGSEE